MLWELSVSEQRYRAVLGVLGRLPRPQPSGHVKLHSMHDESFWIAVSAAAPVIALAAIVAFTDTAGQLGAYWEWRFTLPVTSPMWRRLDLKQIERQMQVSMFIGAALAVANTGLQAAMLGFGLSSLANGRGELSTGLAIGFEVGGLVALALGAVAAAGARLWRADLFSER